ncbi:helix-turn-helix domain-containing protein [Flindersiella endophytica]
MDTLDLLLHPVRMRIVHAMSGGRPRTTSELCARLPDVPKTSLYRQVAILAEGGILDVVDERRVHGAVERHYRLRQDRARIDLEAAKRMSLDDHRHAFAGAVATLLAEFNAYLTRDGADPVADQVGYRQGVLWLSPEELAEFVADLLTSFRARAENGPGAGRRPYLLSAIFFPSDAPDPDPDHAKDRG